MADNTIIGSKSSRSQNGRFRPTNILIWAGILAFIAFMGWGLRNSQGIRPEIGQPAPTFEMSFYDGYQWNAQPVASLDDMQGKIVVVNFWASWCVECRLEADLLQEMSVKYADDVIFVGIAWTDTEPKAREYMAEYGITYPNAPDIGLDIGEVYEITGIPETFFIDRNGVLVQEVIGPVNEQMMDTILTQMITQ